MHLSQEQTHRRSMLISNCQLVTCSVSLDTGKHIRRQIEISAVCQFPESFTDDIPVAYMLNSYLPPELCFILFIRVIRLELGNIFVEAK